jgi:hypothetical protein
MDGPYALLADGTAKYPLSFQAALRADADKLAELQKVPEVANVLLGGDIPAMQSLLKAAYQVRPLLLMWLFKSITYKLNTRTNTLRLTQLA